jgi:hypothetical protein
MGMTAYDLFLLVLTICVIFLTGFICAALYYTTRILRTWNALSQEAAQQIEGCMVRFQEALHSLASLKAIAEIGLQTVKAVGAAYTVSRHGRKSPKKHTHTDDEA